MNTLLNGDQQSFATGERESKRGSPSIQARDHRENSQFPLSRNLRTSGVWYGSVFDVGNLHRAAPPFAASQRASRRTQLTGFSDQEPLLVSKFSGLANGFLKVCERWQISNDSIGKLLHLEQEPWLCEMITRKQVGPLTGDLRDRMAIIIGISVGLGELFNDNLDAELSWLKSSKVELYDNCALDHMLTGSMIKLHQIMELLDRDRGLK